MGVICPFDGKQRETGRWERNDWLTESDSVRDTCLVSGQIQFVKSTTDGRGGRT